MKLNDNVLLKIVQLIQLAMLTGTDVVDYLRQVNLELDEFDGMLHTSNEYDELYDKTINEFLEEIKKLQEEQEEEISNVDKFTVSTEGQSIVKEDGTEVQSTFPTFTFGLVR